MTALKFAEDGDGIVIRLSETGGQPVSADVTVLGVTFRVRCAAFDICTYRIRDGKVTECDFCE
jgi:hypothetical protein